MKSGSPGIPPPPLPWPQQSLPWTSAGSRLLSPSEGPTTDCVEGPSLLWHFLCRSPPNP